MSSLISTTLQELQPTKTIYNAKVIYCNDYIQLYNFDTYKSRNNLDLNNKNNNIVNIDTDNLKKIDTTETKTNEIEYKNELEKKLYEEYKEVIESTGDERVEELADMLEVIRALANLENKNLNDVIAIADKKNEKRGAFEEKIFLEKVIETK